MIRVGDEFTTNEGYKVSVVGYRNKNNVDILFTEPREYVKTVRAGNLKKGHVANPFHCSVYGVGYIGVGKYYQYDQIRKPTPEYKVWSSMLGRVYCENYLNRFPTYRDVTIHDDWYDFQKFGEWCNSQTGFGRDSWDLDKDILVKGNKVYAPDVCCFVPYQINRQFTFSGKTRGEYPLGVTWHKQRQCFIAQLNEFVDGKRVSGHIGVYNNIESAFLAYKKVKEARIREVAEKWKSEIDEKVYQALVNWKIEITD